MSALGDKIREFTKGTVFKVIEATLRALLLAVNPEFKWIVAFLLGTLGALSDAQGTEQLKGKLANLIDEHKTLQTIAEPIA